MRQNKRGIAVLLAVILLISCMSSPAQAANTDIQTALEQAIAAQYEMAAVAPGALLGTQNTYPAGESINDWMAFTLARCNQEEDYEAYLQALEHYVTQQYMQPQTGINGRHRIALTVLALGGDPTAFGTDAGGMAIDLVADSTWNYGGDYALETINITAYALLLLQAADVALPADARYTEATLVQIILAQQNPDGGFGLMAGTSDVDITSMVLQALAGNRDLPQVEDAIASALDYLKDAMAENGTFISYGSDSCESLCQVILALCALGLGEEAMFSTAVQTLLQYQCADGSFRHALADNDGDYMTTQQVILTLCALHRLQTAQPGIYDLADAAPNGIKAVSGRSIVLIGIGIAAVFVTAILVVRKRGNKHV